MEREGEGERDGGRDNKRKNLKRREGPLSSAIENLTSMLSIASVLTYRELIRIESQ